MVNLHLTAVEEIEGSIYAKLLEVLPNLSSEYYEYQTYARDEAGNVIKDEKGKYVRVPSGRLFYTVDTVIVIPQNEVVKLLQDINEAVESGLIISFGKENSMDVVIYNGYVE